MMIEASAGDCLVYIRWSLVGGLVQMPRRSLLNPGRCGLVSHDISDVMHAQLCTLNLYQSIA
jgi:hypothetical protein